PIVKEGYVLTSGSIKLMDFIYCPFGKRCFECNQRRFYRLKDEEGRVFLLRRYRLSSCRFELYNCADLASVQNFAGELVDLSAISDAKALLSAESADDLKRALSSYTSGHSVHSVL
ncbi:MAG: hypothetical protein ACI4U2_03050, partial [Christensenellaceae bacterium]